MKSFVGDVFFVIVDSLLWFAHISHWLFQWCDFTSRGSPLFLYRLGNQLIGVVNCSVTRKNAAGRVCVYVCFFSVWTLDWDSVCVEVDCLCWMGLEGSPRDSDNRLPRVGLVGWLRFLGWLYVYCLAGVWVCTCVHAPSVTSFVSVFMEASPSLLFA